MLKDQNNPRVLAAIKEVVTGNRDNDSKQEKKISENLSSRYTNFAPITRKEVLSEKVLSPKQKKIARVAGDKSAIDAADFKALRAGAKISEAATEAQKAAASAQLKDFIAKGGTVQQIPPKKTPKAKFHASSTAFQRGRGTGKASTIRMEETEQIDEISKKTLRSYMAKAIGSKSASDFATGVGAALDQKDMEARNRARSEKRSKGLMKAILKTTKESVEHVFEAKTLLKTYTGDNGHSAKVYKLSGIHNEGDPYKVQLHKDGKHHEPADYFTNDSEDAHHTAQTMLRHASKGSVKESKDTPGNSYDHQCALHVKSEQYGEGRTLFSQHAEPDSEGNIAWYDVMFNEGIIRVNTEDIEILVSESHGNHKKAKK